MTPAQLFAAIAQLSGVQFGFTSMLAMGLSLSMAQIIQPLKNLHLVFLALLLFLIGSLLIGLACSKFKGAACPEKPGICSTPVTTNLHKIYKPALSFFPDTSRFSAIENRKFE